MFFCLLQEYFLSNSLLEFHCKSRLIFIIIGVWNIWSSLLSNFSRTDIHICSIQSNKCEFVNKFQILRDGT